jgi:phage-related tail protein
MQTIQALGSTEERMKSLKETLQAENARLQKVREEVIAAKACAHEETQAVKNLLSNVVDFEAIERAKSEMRKWERQVGNVAHGKFDEAQEVIWEQRDRLKDAGWRCEGLDYLGNANFNRPERDGVGLMPSGAMLKIHKIKTENTSETARA